MSSLCKRLMPGLSMLSCLPVLSMLSDPAGAQNYRYLPATGGTATFEQNYWNDVPLMRQNTRMQLFYGGPEAGSGTFTANEMALRYDGPIPRVGQPGPFTIQRLVIKLGVSMVAEPDNRMSNNLTMPLTTVFDGPHSYLPDQNSMIPDVFGGPQGTLTFPFLQPVTITVPQNGWLVVEISLSGNSNNGLTHALLDAVRADGGPQPGTAIVSQTGCAVGTGSPARIEAGGVATPGAILSLAGAHLGATAPVITFLGFDDQAGFGTTLPLLVPNTGCAIYSTWDLMLPQVALGDGSIPVGAPSSLLPIPANPAMGGAMFFAQHVSLVPGSNLPWGLAFSDKLTVTLGALSAPDKEVRYTANKNSATADLGDLFAAEAIVIRLRVE